MKLTFAQVPVDFISLHRLRMVTTPVAESAEVCRGLTAKAVTPQVRALPSGCLQCSIADVGAGYRIRIGQRPGASILRYSCSSLDKGRHRCLNLYCRERKQMGNLSEMDACCRRMIGLAQQQAAGGR